MGKPILRLLLPDTSIVIEFHRRGLWQKLIQEYEVIIPETVVKESKFFVDESGFKIPINLTPDIAAGKVTVLTAPASALPAFTAKFDPTYVEKFDPGELELLTLWHASYLGTALVTSADAVVYKTLGRLNQRAAGFSAEELLKSLGASTKDLERRFTEEFRTIHTDKGFGDYIANFTG